MRALSFALAAIQAIPAIIQAGQDAIGFAENTATSVKAMQAANRDPTEAEWDALNTQIEALQNKLI